MFMRKNYRQTDKLELVSLNYSFNTATTSSSTISPVSAKPKEAYRFLGLLEKGGLSATVRRKMGEDIDGACGQLRQRYLEETGDKS